MHILAIVADEERSLGWAMRKREIETALLEIDRRATLVLVCANDCDAAVSYLEETSLPLDLVIIGACLKVHGSGQYAYFASHVKANEGNPWVHIEDACANDTWMVAFTAAQVCMANGNLKQNIARRLGGLMP